MSDADIDKAVKEAAEYEAQDKKRKEAIDAKNEADSLVFQMEDALSKVADKVSESDKATVEADLKALKDILAEVQNGEPTEDQTAKIKEAKEKLMNDSQPIMAKVYEQAQAAGAGADAGAQGAGQAQSGADDNVVDGDFKEV